MYCTGGYSCTDDAGKTKSAWIIIDATGECETGNAAHYIYPTFMSVPLTAGGQQQGDLICQQCCSVCVLHICIKC